MGRYNKNTKIIMKRQIRFDSVHFRTVGRCFIMLVEEGENTHANLFLVRTHGRIVKSTMKCCFMPVLPLLDIGE
jgi:hypothetical protein